MKTETNGRWTTVIAVAALVVSGYTAYASRQNNISTEAALKETKRQFEVAGPKYSAEAFAFTYNTRDKIWSGREPVGTSLAFERMQPPNILVVAVHVTNSGRSRGSIDELGIMGDESTRVTSTNPGCDSPGNKIVSCSVPLSLEPEERVKVYILIDETMRDALTCNQFAESRGMVAYARSISDTEVQAPTQVSIAYSSYCPELPRSSDGTG